MMKKKIAIMLLGTAMASAALAGRGQAQETEAEYVLVADGRVIADGLYPKGFAYEWCKWKTKDGSVTVRTAGPYNSEPLEVTREDEEAKEYYWGAAVIPWERYKEEISD